MPTLQSATMAALFDRIVDDASLFPPASLSMPAAVDRHLADLGSGNPILTHRFVCPARRLPELQDSLGPESSLSVSVIVGSDDDAELVAAAQRDARLTFRSLEFALGRPLDDVEAFLDRVGADVTQLEVFVERPFGEGLAGEASRLAGRGWGLKLRCGGVRSDLFPTGAEVAAALIAAAHCNAAFKATAGLHHALPYVDSETGFAHQGFVTLILAVSGAVSGADAREICARLQLKDSSRVLEELAAIDLGLATRARDLFRSYGSCSTSEPLNDLIRLGLVASREQ